MEASGKKSKFRYTNEESPGLIDIFSQSPISIELYDNNGKLVDVNQACINLFGLNSSDDVKGLSLFKNPYLTEQAIIDLHSGKSVNYELAFDFDLIKRRNLFPTKREGICFLECFISPTKKLNNKISGYTVYITEITERKKAEEKLIRSEERFRRIVEASTRGMYFYKLDDNNQLILIGANPAADQIIGITHQYWLGKTIEEVFPNLAQTEVLDTYKQIARGECGPAEFDIEYQDKHVTGYFNVQAFQTETNLITVNFTDISERRRAELLLEKQTKELRELNATKDKFMSIIAHDLKSPFNAIIGFTDLMLRNFDQLDDDTFLKGLRTIESASNHAYKLLENLLIWSQNQSGRREYSPEHINLKAQINESLKLVESTAVKKGVQISIRINKAYTVFADKNMIDSILRNLISNAIKFSNKGGKIKVTATQVDQEVHISVSDNGVGISPERLSAIFEIDKRTNTAGTENELGTGLGLILCKDFVTRHNGKIWAESTLDEGSSFTFSLPLN